MEFKIESGIARVANRGGGGRGRKPTAFPFAEMSVGDSFLIPCDVKEKKVLDSWRRKVLLAKKRFNEQYQDAEWKFSTGLQPDGLRVWRTA